MKQLSVQEKAKAYDEVIERAKKVLLDCTPEEQKVVEYISPELKKSEDEKIRKDLITYLKSISGDSLDLTLRTHDWLAWLEKQGEHANFRNKIQIGDKVTRNEDGVLVNLSQLSRVAKRDMQILANSAKTCKDEQNPAWSEEDEKMLNDILMCGEHHCYLDAGNIDWLKNLKDRVQPQNTWKPSDEQMEALDFAADCIVPTEFCFKRRVLKELLEQLKKLKE